jgi:hypothetical protein
MSFQQFTFPQVLQDLGLTLHDADLFVAAPPLSVEESLTIDVPEYYVDNLPRVMGILRQIVETT